MADRVLTSVRETVWRRLWSPLDCGGTGESPALRRRKCATPRRSTPLRRFYGQAQLPGNRAALLNSKYSEYVQKDLLSLQNGAEQNTTT
ncbi:MAG: hypothetical protein LBK01_04030 [Burkholderiaceae bacterium]|nr:hypothetical protein [Burkholderiaceae bacterium]